MLSYFAKSAFVLSLTTAITLWPTVVMAQSATVFQGVRVLSMTEGGVIENANVTVEGDRIVNVDADSASLPEGARVIDGSGRTLMPGLADMHVHYWSETEGPLYLANSVTTVRNMWGSATTLVLDAKAKAGNFIGPHIYTPGPLMDGPEPIWGDGSAKITTAEAAIGAVESQRTTGYKAVKLYEGLTPDIYRAAVAAAKERGMQVYTHTPNGLSVEEVIALGVDSIEHFDDVSESIFVATDETTNVGYFTRWANADPEKMQGIAELSAAAGVWHSPTFAVIAKRYEYGGDAEAFFASPDAAHVGPGLTGWWADSASRMGPYDEERQAAARQQRRFLKMLYDAGAPLLLGTDTPNPFVLPGFAIHDELAAFVDAGIPVEDVLRIATADAAKFVREEGEWGVIAEGARADLVLLDADPRDDLAALRQPSGVMMNGIWYDATALADKLVALKEGAAAAAK